MNTISSFQVDHERLLPGLYVSSYDTVGDRVITTFDIRMKQPNSGSYLTTTQAHTIEHIGATYLRNDPEWQNKIVYFGPMGCRTGFYLILKGEYESLEIVNLIRDLFHYMVSYEGPVPGASSIQCGNYKDLDLQCIKDVCNDYLQILSDISYSRSHYYMITE